MKISVCMATYNGDAFVSRQLETILNQLTSDDEVIIVDDCSNDKTVEVIRSFNDSRVTLYSNERNRREIYSFNRAIEQASGDIIFLADQDDVWLPGRVALMSKSLSDSQAWLVTTNFAWITAEEKPLDMNFDGVRSADSQSHFKNIVDVFIGRTNYFGCAMAFRRELLSLIIPIPSYVESHDLWIALAANVIGSNLHLDDETFLKRSHGKNATSTVSSRSLYLRLRARAIFVRSLLDLRNRRRSLRAD